MSYPNTSEDVKVVFDEWKISISQMQPANYQDHVADKKTMQELHLTLEGAALLAAKLLHLVAVHGLELDNL